MRSGWTTPQDSIFIPDTGTHSPGMALPRIAWVWLNQFPLLLTQMEYGLICECGAEEQTIDLQCLIHRPPHGLHGLMVLDDETIE